MNYFVKASNFCSVDRHSNIIATPEIDELFCSLGSATTIDELFFLTYFLCIGKQAGFITMPAIDEIFAALFCFV